MAAEHFERQLCRQMWKSVREWLNGRHALKRFTELKKKQSTTLLTTISKNPLYEPWSSFLFFFFFYGFFCVMQTNLSSVKAPKHQDRGIILSICNQCLILTFTNIQTGIVTCAYSPVSHNCSTNKLGDKLKSHIKFYSAFHQCSLTIKFPNPEENARLCPADMCSHL